MHRRCLVASIALVIALTAGSSVAQAGGGNSASAKLCQKNYWQRLQTSTGRTFASQSECVSYGANGGTLYEPYVLAYHPGCSQTQYPGFDLWALLAKGFTPYSSVTVNGTALPFHFDSGGWRQFNFIPDPPAGQMITITVTDGNGVHASVTFGPTEDCST